MENMLTSFIKDNNVDAEHIIFQESCHTVDEAAKAVGVQSSDFVKSICMVSGAEIIIAIVLGTDRASTKNVAKAFGIPRPELATHEDILKYTGYPCGGTPPFGFDAKFVIDNNVMEKEFIYAGGGSENSLVRLSPKEMLRANNGAVARIRK